MEEEEEVKLYVWRSVTAMRGPRGNPGIVFSLARNEGDARQFALAEWDEEGAERQGDRETFIKDLLEKPTIFEEGEVILWYDEKNDIPPHSPLP